MRLDILAVALIAAGFGGIGYLLADRTFQQVSLRDLLRPPDTRPLLARVLLGIEQFYPAEVVEEQLVRAGNPWRLTPAQWITVRLAALVGMPLLTFAAIRNLPGAVIGVVLGALLPWLALKRLAGDRQIRIAGRVPVIANLTATMLAAGAATPAYALERAIDERFDFDRMLRDALKEAEVIKFEPAIYRAGVQAGCEEARTFCGLLAQSASLGATVTEAFKAQAKQILAIQAASRKAQTEKAKTYLTIITIVFMFVPLGLIALLPAWKSVSGM